ncbi:Pentatricopeptide repeat-containing protein [Nymphaea thermarum]|nr:Pentatricopeptide repeat-containing protein [Nymphaea thermarum]
MLLRCSSLVHLQQVHAHLLTNHIFSSPTTSNFIAVKLIGLYASFSRLPHAAFVFAGLPAPNIFAWNTILKSCAQNHCWGDVVRYFNELGAAEADEYTFTSVLKACAGLVAVVEGKEIHGFVLKKGFKSNLFVRNSLVDMYFKFGDPKTAGQLFDEMTVRDVVSWNTTVAGFSLCGDVDSAREMFDRMPEKNMVSWSAMIAGYTRVGDTVTARRFFDDMPERNVVAWNTMIAGYAQNEKFVDAIALFRQMQVERVKPDEVTFVSVLSACAHLGALDLGKWIDRYINKVRMQLSLFLGNALADMYAKCGCIESSCRVFSEMVERDVISWSIIIAGLAMHGHADEAFKYFWQMSRCGMRPNDITFMGVLSACTHAGLVDEGMHFFNLMSTEYQITPKIEHYGCVVDLLSRAGRLDEAVDLIDSMPIAPNVIIWGAVLGGCRIHKDIHRGQWVVQKILELDSEHSGSYVYLANVYASVGRLDDAARCRLMMKEKRVVKTPGCSWIEIDNTVYEFLMGDRSHPESEKIYSMVAELRVKLKLAGYTPNTDLVTHSIDEEEKENALSTHSEKLAIAFALVSTSEGTPIRIVKNLRMKRGFELVMCHQLHG